MRVWTVVSVAVLALAGVVIAGARDGYPAQRPHQLSGAAWLASSQVGQLTLLDGTTADVAAQVRVARSGEILDVVQQGATGYAVNRSTGTVRRVDGATFDVGTAVSPVPAATGGLHAFAGPDAVYALDEQRGLLTRLDPVSLAGRAPLARVAAKVSAQGAAADPTGQLWLLDAASGDLVRSHGDQREVRPHTVSGAGGLLTMAGGVPVLVDPGRGRATVLDPQTGAARRSVDLHLQDTDRIAVSGSPDAARLYVVTSGGVVVICNLNAGGCGTAVSLAGAGADLGAAVEAGGRVFVPDYSTGQVWIVDLSRAQLLAQPRILSPNTRFDLLTRDGIVFFNDPRSEHAGVVHLDGSWTMAKKYEPSDPGKGVTTPAAPPEPARPPSAPPPGTPPPGTPPPGGPAPAPGQPRPVPAPKPGPAGTLQIVVSRTTAQVGEDVTLEARATAGPAPAGPQWDFGDGQRASGVQVTHHWGTAQAFTVTLQATLDGAPAMASVTVQVVPRPVGNLIVRNSGNGSVVSTPAGISCPPQCSGSFPVGQSITLTATPVAGGTFDGWSGCPTPAADTCQLVMTRGDVQVGANFSIPDVTLTVVASPAGIGAVTGPGINCSSTCTARMPPGTPVTLTANPFGRATFSGWTGPCAGQGSTCVFTLSGNTTVVANFTPAPVIVLTGATITFFTHDDDKDNDTFLNVQVVAPGGRVCAGLSGTFGLFPDQSTRGPFGLSVQSNVLKDSLPGGHLTISIQPNGNDTWRFGYQLDLTFSDGSVAHTSQAAVQLTQDSRTLTQPLAF